MPPRSPRIFCDQGKFLGLSGSFETVLRDFLSRKTVVIGGFHIAYLAVTKYTSFAECVQSLCKIYFYLNEPGRHENGLFKKLKTGFFMNRKPSAFVSASGFQKKTLKKQVTATKRLIIPDRVYPYINFTEPLCTLCDYPFS